MGSSPDAPSYLPEDLFEARMKEVLGHIEKDRSHPNIEAFWQAVVNGDQGPRALRQIRSRLQDGSGALNHPKNEKLLNSLARNIHEAYAKGDGSARSFEDIFRRKIEHLIRRLEGDHDPFSVRLKSELQRMISET